MSSWPCISGKESRGCTLSGNVRASSSMHAARQPAGRRHMRTGKKVALVFAAIVAIAVLYLCLWPVPAEPRAWQAPTPPGYVGPYAPNKQLSALRSIDLGEDFGPEHLAIGP